MKVLPLVSLSFAIFAQSASAAGRPGNVFLAGDDVQLAALKSWGDLRAVDIARREVGQGTATDGAAHLGGIPIGYFEVREKDGAGMITAAVLEK